MLEISLLKEKIDLQNGLVWLLIIGKLKGDDHVRKYFLRTAP